MSDQGSGYEWKRKRGWFNRTAEKIEDLPANLLSSKGALTTSRKREIYEKGTPGQATILKAPDKSMISPDYGGDGRYTLRVELPGRDPYEVKTFQDVTGWDWKRLTPGTIVEVRVDPDDHERLVLCPPETGEPVGRVMDSSEILAEGRRATATIQASEPFGKTAPGTDDPIYVLRLELRADSEGQAWSVQIGQRVPRGAEEMVAAGRELVAAYLEVDEGDSVAIDWPASTGGKYS
jgi:hypothetical protein